MSCFDPKMLRIPKWRPAFPLTLRCKDRLELFFERRGHGQAFDDNAVQGVPGIRFKSFAFSRVRRRTPDPIASNLVPAYPQQNKFPSRVKNSPELT
jgi:hypothetical protein